MDTTNNAPNMFGRLTVHGILSGLAIVVGVLMLVVIIPLEDEPTAIPLVLIAGGVGWYFVTRRRPEPTPTTTVRLASALAIVSSLLLIWLSLGVGIIGADGDPANMMYFGVLAIGLVVALIGRFRPAGLSRALLAAACAQAFVFAVAVAAGLGQPWSGPLELLGLNGFFVVMFAGSALLFRYATGTSGIGT